MVGEIIVIVCVSVQRTMSVDSFSNIVRDERGGQQRQRKLIFFRIFSFLSSIPSHFICYLLKLVYTIISECSAGKSKSLNAASAVSICKDTTNAVDVGVVQQMESVDKDEIFTELFETAAAAAADATNDDGTDVGNASVSVSLSFHPSADR